MDSRQIAWLFFGLKGRVSRAAFFLAGMLTYILQAFLLYRFTLEPEQSSIAEMLALAFWASVIVSIWCFIALGVKRFHDFDKQGVLAVTLFIPVVSIIAFIVLCAVPGTPGANKYGSRTNAPA